ncbi:hypothetical protein SAMD00019534_078130 [Acytostelium subglobosum LB1]|uniref:hypothetical protein n=1 Tax=Acytostelium subglobosum LB1 TaxID=1410327 RepID=UPI000644912E|nr:hypothetical protein SAMD00019534_078130 [Acytostelium subglobosum LB1]GAM24638.1 hypothetical protein SAMD00019534_078130 [Acytostelium subglobosum LB1]|eukprot:XP_012752307.1 hypothetical protein SAMD00019534_078130 [Acytostelium subglobosum LB1]
MVLQENDTFLTALNNMFKARNSKGSVWITIKRYTPEDKKGEAPTAAEEKEHMCLVRATDGQKKKISTLVEAKDITSFQQSIRNVLLINVDNLKKEQKEKKKPAAVVKRANKV